MMIEAIHNTDAKLLKLGMQDRLHQQYRTKLVPGLDEIIKNLKHKDNVLGTALSGAGPGIIVITDGADTDEVKNIIRDTWAEYSVKVDLKTVNAEMNGAKFL